MRELAQHGASTSAATSWFAPSTGRSDALGSSSASARAAVISQGAVSRPCRTSAGVVTPAQRSAGSGTPDIVDPMIRPSYAIVPATASRPGQYALCRMPATCSAGIPTAPVRNSSTASPGRPAAVLSSSRRT